MIDATDYPKLKSCVIYLITGNETLNVEMEPRSHSKHQNSRIYWAPFTKKIVNMKKHWFTIGILGCFLRGILLVDVSIILSE